MRKSYDTYEQFDADTGYSEKCGFKLTELQVQDVHTFLCWDRSMNTYEVGVGKTVVSSTVALMRGQQQKLVLVPPILIRPWVKWLSKVSDGVLAYAGTPSERAKMDVKNAHWVVMSFDIFRRDVDKLALHSELEIIVDECHNLKNPQSVLFRKLSRIL